MPGRSGFMALAPALPGPRVACRNARPGEKASLGKLAVSGTEPSKRQAPGAADACGRWGAGAGHRAGDTPLANALDSVGFASVLVGLSQIGTRRLGGAATVRLIMVSAVISSRRIARSARCSRTGAAGHSRHRQSRTLRPRLSPRPRALGGIITLVALRDREAMLAHRRPVLAWHVTPLTARTRIGITVINAPLRPACACARVTLSSPMARGDLRSHRTRRQSGGIGSPLCPGILRRRRANWRAASVSAKRRR